MTSEGCVERRCGHQIMLVQKCGGVKQFISPSDYSAQLPGLLLNGWRKVVAGEEMVEAVQTIGELVGRDEALDLVLWGQCSAITSL